jgi:hypothetical protein
LSHAFCHRVDIYRADLGAWESSGAFLSQPRAALAAASLGFRGTPSVAVLVCVLVLGPCLAAIFVGGYAFSGDAVVSSNRVDYYNGKCVCFQAPCLFLAM